MFNVAAMRTASSKFMATMASAVLAWCISPLMAAPETPARSTGAFAKKDLASCIPSGAKLVKRINVNLGKGRSNETVVAYGSDSIPMVSIGVRILQQGASGWSIDYEESGSVINGAGPRDAIDIEKLHSSQGKDLVIVIIKNSGAGTTTDWHGIAYVHQKIVAIDPSDIRAKVLRARDYTFMGYNGVTVKDGLVLEEISGYSPHTARCCPDLPSLVISSRFNGASFQLVSVKKLPLN